MELALSVAAACVGGVFGWFAAGYQHQLYRQPEYRENPARGERLLFNRIWLGVTSALVAGIAFRPDHYDFGPALMTALFGLTLLVLASTDFERRIIPNNLSYPAIVAAAALCWAWPDRDVQEILFGALFALIVGAGMFLLGLAFGAVIGATATPFGMGDVKLILLLGLLLGWPVAMSALLIGVVAAGVPAIVLMLSGRSRGVFAYGPYLAIGGIVGLLWFDRFG